MICFFNKYKKSVQKHTDFFDNSFFNAVPDKPLATRNKSHNNQLCTDLSRFNSAYSVVSHFLRFAWQTTTDEERKLWYCFLRNYPVRFFRQKVVYKYIADFYCPTANLVIELDGSQHYEEKGLTYDDERNRFLEEHGIRVIHIANNQIHTNFRNVCEYIDMLVKGEL